VTSTGIGKVIFGAGTQLKVQISEYSAQHICTLMFSFTWCAVYFCLMVLILIIHSLSFCAVVNCCVYIGNKMVFGRGTQVVVTARKSYYDLTSNTKCSFSVDK